MLSDGKPAVLTRIDADGGCVVTFTVEGREEQATYASMYGYQKGSARLQKPLVAGDDVLSHGDPAELTSINPDGSCVVTFRSGGGEQQVTYNSMYGKQAGSARLQRPPPTLAPPPRATPSNAISKETRALVDAHAKSICPESPCKRDHVRRHVGPHVWLGRQALIMLMPIYAMHAAFCVAHGKLLSLAK